MQNTTSSTRTFQTAPPTEPKPPKKERPSLKANFGGKRLPWLLIVVLTLFSMFMIGQYHQAQRKLQSGSANTQQVEGLVTKVGKLIILPAGETPTIATVLHADKLKDQSFFANAKDGDKVLVYNKEKEAILYRPSTNQIVKVSQVTVNSTGNTSIQNQ